MKIRKGFVTNSSSSSFIISTTKSSVEKLLNDKNIAKDNHIDDVKKEQILDILDNSIQISDYDQLLRMYKAYSYLDDKDDLEIMLSEYHLKNIETYYSILKKNNFLMLFEHISDCSDMYDLIYILGNVLNHDKDSFFEVIN